MSTGPAPSRRELGVQLRSRERPDDVRQVSRIGLRGRRAGLVEVGDDRIPPDRGPGRSRPFPGRRPCRTPDPRAGRRDPARRSAQREPPCQARAFDGSSPAASAVRPRRSATAGPRRRLHRRHRSRRTTGTVVRRPLSRGPRGRCRPIPSAGRGRTPSPEKCDSFRESDTLFWRGCPGRTGFANSVHRTPTPSWS